MQMWYKSVDGTPGINTDALEIIRERAAEYKAKNNHQLHLALISDEMAVRKQICWNNFDRAFDGFVTITNSSKHPEPGGDEVDEEVISRLKVAKDALVFCVVGPDFKLAVAYQLLNGLESIDRAALTFEVVKSIEETGSRVIAITADGLKANITTAEFLGAKFQAEQTFFESPTYPNQKIYFIFDPPHMLKLVRRQFSKKQIFHGDNLLDWKLLSILVTKQTDESINLCNKLTHRHIEWSQKPMNVKLAAETISRSVADALDQLRSDDYAEFKESGPTAEFLRKFNDAFDVFNVSEKNENRSKFKQKLSKETAADVFHFLDELKMYIKQLNILVQTKAGGEKIKPILDSGVKMGFFGFIVDAISLKGIYEDFVRDGPLEAFYTMQFSQDHLKTYFSMIRNSLGRNENPNSAEFRSAFKKLLVCHPCLTSRDHNSISNATKILTVSSATKKKPPIHDADEPIELEDEIDRVEMIENEIEGMEPFQHHMYAFAALEIEKLMKTFMSRSKEKWCSQCADVFNENSKIQDELLAKKQTKHKQAEQPCESTLKIVIISNAVLKQIRRTDIEKAQTTIFNNIFINDLYTSSDFEHHRQHTTSHLQISAKERFIMEVVQQYLRLKSEFAGRLITNEEQGVWMRNRMKAKVHHKGQ